MAKSKADNKTSATQETVTDSVEQPKPTKEIQAGRSKDLILNRDRKTRVRIEPSPFKRTNLKLKMSQAKVNSAGYAVTDTTGQVQKSDVDVDDAIQVPGTAKTLGPVLTASGLKTGLEVIVDNPYNDEIIYYPDWGEKVLKGKDRVALQHVLEYKHRKEFNYYTGQLFDRINPSDSISELPFFLTPVCKITLTGNVTFLDLTNPIHEVQYYVLKAHPEIANSYSELMEGRNQRASYYIVDEEEVQDAKAEKLRRKNAAAAALRELDDAGHNILINMALVLGNEDRTISKEKALQWIDNYYNKNKANMSTFMKWFEIYKDAARREKFFAMAILQEMLNYGIIRTKDNKYYWVKPETESSPIQHFEWPSKEKVINDFILAPEYQEEFELAKSIHESRK